MAAQYQPWSVRGKWAVGEEGGWEGIAGTPRSCGLGLLLGTFTAGQNRQNKIITESASHCDHTTCTVHTKWHSDIILLIREVLHNCYQADISLL